MQKYFDINESGYSIRCKLYCNDVHAIKKAVIFGHGFGGHKDNKAAEKFAAKLISKHREFCVVTFNWPCHGDDARKNLLLGECDTYLTTLIEYVKREFHTPAITIYDSMIHRIIPRDEYDKILKGKPVLAGFDRKIKISKSFLEELKAADITQYDYMDYADDILIIHGTKDEIIPFDKSAEFADQNVIEFVPMTNGDHRFTDPKIMDLTIHTIIEFFELADRR